MIYQKLLVKKLVSILLVNPQLVSVKSLKTNEVRCSANSVYFDKALSTFFKTSPPRLVLALDRTHVNTEKYF